jgi:hypothetical protein
MRLLTLAFLFILNGVVLAQSASDTRFNNALQLFSDGRFNEVVEVLSGSFDSRSILFTAKAEYALGNFSNSLSKVRELQSDANAEIRSEALLVLALAQYQTMDIAGAINSLDQLLLTANSPYSESIVDQAQRLKSELLSSLSFNQRLQAIGSVRNIETKRSLVTQAYNQYPRELAESLVRQLSRSDRDFNQNGLPISVSSLPTQPKLPSKVSLMPGSIINIGILLPTFESDAASRSVSRGLHNGVLIAVDEYNRTHIDRKVQVHFISAESLSRSSLDQIERHVKSLNINALIGPLFSEQVRDVGIMASRLGIPVFAPLANTFERTSQMEFVFQLNPTFASRGESSARIAFEKLGLRKAGVMAESGTQGESDARAFVNTFKELGGEVPYIFVEDFAKMGYFVGEHTPWFANNQSLVDSTQYTIDTLDVVYFPFTGEVAGTLLNLTLTGLEAYNPNYIILGNDEMAYIEHSSDRLRKLNLMYTGTSYLDQSTQNAQNFRFDYLNRSGIDPNTFSYLGYDIGKYYLWALDQIGNPDDFMIFSPALPPYSGLSNSVFFGTNRNNQALNLFEITSQGSRIVDTN